MNTTQHTTDHLYIHDDGRCTCAKHAGAELATSIKYNPTAQFHRTPRGTWERFTVNDIRLFCTDIDCEECPR